MVCYVYLPQKKKKSGHGMVQLDPRSGCYQIRNANSTVHMNFDAAKLSKFTEF